MFLIRYKKGKKLSEEQARENALASKRKYYYKNKNKALAYAKEYYQENKDKLLSQSKKWRDNNPEKVREYNRKNYQKNREKISKQRREYYERNRERILENAKKWREQNPDRVKELNKTTHKVIFDRIEAGTYLIAGATMGDITLNNCNPKHLNDVINKLKLSGANITSTENSVSIEKIDTIKAVDLTTEVYPGFPTDLQAQWMAFMSIAKGKSIIIDTVYHDRFTHIPELNRLGADIQLTDNKAVVNGVNKLKLYILPVIKKIIIKN